MDFALPCHFRVIFSWKVLPVDSFVERKGVDDVSNFSLLITVNQDYVNY
jgi:hypothetical protein